MSGRTQLGGRGERDLCVRNSAMAGLPRRIIKVGNRKQCAEGEEGNGVAGKEEFNITFGARVVRCYSG